MRSILGSCVARTIALSTTFALAAAAQTARGTTSAMHIKIAAVGDGPMATAMKAQQAEWRGVTTSVANRGRVDIVEGAQPPLMQQGDYMLFEGTDAIVVKPAEKSFVLLQSAQLGGRAMLGGLQITLNNAVAKLDTLGPGETIDGRPTQQTYDVYKVLQTELTKNLTDLRKVMADNLPKINAMLRAAGLKPIDAAGPIS